MAAATLAAAVPAPSATARAPGARSASTRGVRVPGPASFQIGFVDDPLFEFSDPAYWLKRARQTGSGWVRLTAYWSQIAPAHPAPGFDAANPGDPQYDFYVLDRAVRAATAAHQHVLIMILSPPLWALGPGRPAGSDSWRPSPRDLGQFARALALRYSGRFPDPADPRRRLPRVSFYQAWNEPNLPGQLSPQWTRRRQGRWAPASPVFYRRMLNAVYANVKSVQPHAFVLAAGMSPYGEPPGVGRMHPVTFISALLCLRQASLRPERCPDRAHLDALDDHPYSPNPTIHAYSPLDTSVPDVHRLARLLAIARRDRLVVGARSTSVWVTEIDWSSKPPARYIGVPPQTQARYLAYGFYELWRQRIGHVLWFELADPPQQVQFLFIGGGVLYDNGRAKPAARAFRFPFVALPATHGSLVLWGRAPHAGRVEIQYGNGRGWHRLFALRTTRGGVFYARRRLRRGIVLRAAQGRLAAPGFRAVSAARGPDWRPKRR